MDGGAFHGLGTWRRHASRFRDGAEGRAIESTSARLSCYDAAFPPKTRKPAETSSYPRLGEKDPFLAEEVRTAAKLKNICRGC